MAYYGDHENNPIVRFGRVAMLPKDRVSWPEDPSKPPEQDQLYLLETQSYGGNSGSPVFFMVPPEIPANSILLGGSRQDKIMFAGVMKGFFGFNSPIGFAPSPTNNVIPYSSQNIGIAAVTPSFLLHDILFSPELAKVRVDYVEPPATKQ